MPESSMKEISLRIKSITNTRKITRAMELVAASKLIKAREQAEKSRGFYTVLYEAICDIASMDLGSESTFVAGRDVKNSCFVVISGDRGLAGGYNINLHRFADKLMADKPSLILPIGKRAADYYTKRNGNIITRDFIQAEDLSVGSCYEIGRLLSEMYEKKEFDELFVVYTNFISVITQEPAALKLLPIGDIARKEEKKAAQGEGRFVLVEPGGESVFNAIVPSFISGIVWGAVCESRASEFASRRNAMESATKNAQDIIDNLERMYNRARQGSITQEITEIIAGSGM